MYEKKKLKYISFRGAITVTTHHHQTGYINDVHKTLLENWKLELTFQIWNNIHLRLWKLWLEGKINTRLTTLINQTFTKWYETITKVSFELKMKMKVNVQASSGNAKHMLM